MRIEEVRALTDENLKQELDGSYKELLNLRFQKAIQQLSDSTAIRKARKKLARLKTAQRERELARQYGQVTQ